MGLKTLLDYPALAADYASYHTHPRNRACHMVGIPLILLAVVRWTQWPEISVVPAVLALLPLYLIWSLPLGLGLAAQIMALALVAPLLASWMAWTAFIFGWVVQFVGHGVYERRSPAFMKNMLHFLVGPAWVLSETVGMVPSRNRRNVI